MTGKIPKILVYGYGNPGRQDDGLGVLLAEAIEKWTSDGQLDHVHTDSNYQLNLEDAADIAHYDIVIFADASRADIGHFSLIPLEPSDVVEFTMHAVSPAFILHLCSEVFNRTPRAYLLHIRGYEWEFMGKLTEKARKNLNLATENIKSFILDTVALSE